MIATTIQLVVFTAYILFLLRRYGVLKSISKSTYVLEGKEKFLFTITLTILAIANINQPIGIFANISTLGLLFTGATVTFERKGTITPILHYTGATIAILSAMVGLIVHYGVTWILLPPLIALIKLRENKTLLWWVEIVAFYSIIIAYYFI